MYHTKHVCICTHIHTHTRENKCHGEIKLIKFS